MSEAVICPNCHQSDMVQHPSQVPRFSCSIGGLLVLVAVLIAFLVFAFWPTVSNRLNRPGTAGEPGIVLTFSPQILAFLLFLGIGIVFMVVTTRNMQKALTQTPGAMERWQRMHICQRCKHVFVPGEGYSVPGEQVMEEMMQFSPTEGKHASIWRTLIVALGGSVRGSKR
jgi:hypothetical protein